MFVDESSPFKYDTPSPHFPSTGETIQVSFKINSTVNVMLYIWSSNIDSFTPAAHLCITGKYFSPCRININLRISKICALYVNKTISKKGI